MEVNVLCQAEKGFRLVLGKPGDVAWSVNILGQQETKKLGEAGKGGSKREGEREGETYHIYQASLWYQGSITSQIMKVFWYTVYKSKPFEGDLTSQNI